MSASSDSQDWYRVQTWHRQSIDALTDDPSIMESLLEQAVKDTQQLAKVSLLVKQRIWLADTQRMQGNYPQAISLYELLMDLIDNSDFDYLYVDNKIVWCVTKAFLGFVESKRLSSDVDVEQLLQKLDKGLTWLEKKEIGKPSWAAGLQLQKGLLLKAQGKINDAYLAMKDALARKRLSQEAPGYPLAIHQLEYSDLLSNDAIKNYAEAVGEAQKVLDTEGNSTFDRQWAFQTLAHAQMGLGELDAARDSLKQAQILAYTLESSDALTAMTQLLGRLPRQVERMVEDISKQTVKTISEHLTQPGAKQVQPDDSQHKLSEQIEALQTIQEQLVHITNSLHQSVSFLSSSIQQNTPKVAQPSQPINEQAGLTKNWEFEQVKDLSKFVIEQVKDLSKFTIEQARDLHKLPQEQSGVLVDLDAINQTPIQQYVLPQDSSSKKSDVLRNCHQHIICLVALPSDDKPPPESKNDYFHNVLLPALRQVLELDPFYWQVVCEDEKFFENIERLNVFAWLEHAQAYIVDISDGNFKAAIELGAMLYAKKPEQPLLVLKREDSTQPLTGILGGNYVMHYSVPATAKYEIVSIADELKSQFLKHDGILQLNKRKKAHYLSPLYLEKEGICFEKVAVDLSQKFITMEALVLATDEDYRQRTIDAGVNAKFVDPAKEIIIEKLKGLGVNIAGGKHDEQPPKPG